MFKIIQLHHDENQMLNDINTMLFNVDPANTACKENDLQDEYVGVANAVVDKAYEQPAKVVTYDMMAEIIQTNFGMFDVCALTSAETIAAMAGFFTEQRGYIFVADNKTWNTVMVNIDLALYQDLSEIARMNGKTVEGLAAEVLKGFVQ